jgi:hypothetical protein
MILKASMTTAEIAEIYNDSTQLAELVDLEEARLQEQLDNPELPDPADSQVVTIEELTVFTPGKMEQALEAYVSQEAMKNFLSKDALEGITVSPADVFADYTASVATVGGGELL